MPAAPSFVVLQRLWRLLELLTSGEDLTRNELARRLEVEDRTLGMDFTRLRAAGVRVRHRRSTGTYSAEWPDEVAPLRLSREQFFYMYYASQTLKEEAGEVREAQDLARRLALAVNGETDPVYDCGPAYGIGQGVTGSLLERFETLKEAIARRLKLAIQYAAPDEAPALRIIHPQRLLHTPTSWYVLAWCEDRSAFRKFKLARIRDLKLLRDRFTPHPLDLRAELGDAWWLQKGPEGGPTYEVRVLFTGEAAQTIREYRMHASQTEETRPEGTLVTWRLSHLGECATWLMQWLGQIVLLGPQALKDEIAGRLEHHGRSAAARPEATRPNCHEMTHKLFQLSSQIFGVPA